MDTITTPVAPAPAPPAPEFDPMQAHIILADGTVMQVLTNGKFDEAATRALCCECCPALAVVAPDPYAGLHLYQAGGARIAVTTVLADQAAAKAQAEAAALAAAQAQQDATDAQALAQAQQPADTPAAQPTPATPFFAAQPEQPAV